MPFFDEGSGPREWMRILSPGVRVEWMGWKSTLHELHEKGWEVSVMEDLPHMRYSVYLRNKKMDCVACGNFDRRIMQFLRPQGYYECSHTPHDMYLQVGMRIAHNIFLMEAAPALEFTRPINPFPEYSLFDGKNVSLKEMKIFRDEDTVAQHEVFIEEKPVREPTISELLQLALEKQQPEQDRIRKEEMRRRSMLKVNIRMAA